MKDVKKHKKFKNDFSNHRANFWSVTYENKGIWAVVPQFETDLDEAARICLMLDSGPFCFLALTTNHIHRRSLQSS